MGFCLHLILLPLPLQTVWLLRLLLLRSPFCHLHISPLAPCRLHFRGTAGMAHLGPFFLLHQRWSSSKILTPPEDLFNAVPFRLALLALSFFFGKPMHKFSKWFVHSSTSLFPAFFAWL